MPIAQQIAQQVEAVTSAAAQHRGESPLQFHLKQWAEELNQPEARDFHASDDTFNLAVAAALVHAQHAQ